MEDKGFEVEIGECMHTPSHVSAPKQARAAELMQMLTAAVKGLNHLDRLVPVVEDLGRRHAKYGVADAHYDTVGAALLWTLEKGLGSAFTPDAREAWATVYGLLATTMKTAAARELVLALVARKSCWTPLTRPMVRAPSASWVS